MPGDISNGDAESIRGSQIVVDAELERLLINSFASNDELVEALTNLRAHCLADGTKGTELLAVIINASLALTRAIHAREAV